LQFHFDFYSKGDVIALAQWRQRGQSMMAGEFSRWLERDKENKDYYSTVLDSTLLAHLLFLGHSLETDRICLTNRDQVRDQEEHSLRILFLGRH
jgi:hypothetical protein